MVMFLLRDLVSPRTWLAMTNHLVGLVTGLAACIIVVVGVAVGLGTAPLALVGLPLLGLTLRFDEWFARAERFRFGLLLGARMPDWPAGHRAGYRWLIVPRLRMLRERSTWTGVAYSLLRLPVSMLAACISVCVWAVGLAMVAYPAYASSLPRGGATFGSTVLRGGAFTAASLALGVLLLLAAPQLTRAFAVFDEAFTRKLLCPPTDLQARVDELTQSRDRVVDAAEAERRRIERDLHDGAQQRLVALAMELGRAKAKFGSDVEGAMELIDQAHVEAKAALTELRNLVRGVHPPVLTDRGLDAALSGLAALCPVPVDVQVDVPVRPKASVEAVAYFVVAEALTNIAKHSRASHARVVVEGRGYPGTLTVMISDDGIGGANPRSPGLAGLADRVSGVDGTMSVESPSGGPTIIAVELPCG
jgi:signal transduction histidine kinase